MGVGPDDTSPVPRPELFDFRDPLPMPAGAERLVGTLTESVGRVGLLLAAAAGRAVPVTCGGVRRVALVEVAGPGDVWAPLDCGLPGTCLLLFPGGGAVAFADLLMGGVGAAEDRPATRMEQGLLMRHIVPALWPMAASLAAYGVSGLAAGPPSDDPLPAGTGEVIAVLLDVALPAGSTVRLVLCLPARSLLPAAPERRLPAPGPAEDVLGHVPVTVAVRLPASIVRASDMEELAPGDVLRLDPGAADQLTGVLVRTGGDLQVLTAGLGRRGRRRAVVVHDVLEGA